MDAAQIRLEQSYRKQSFWLDTMPGSLRPRPGLDGDIDADVAVVGAGFTGLWTAYYLKQHAPDLKTVVLEAEIAGFGASGRNGGWCSSYLSGLEEQASDPAKREAAIRLQRLMFDTVREVGRVAAREAIDCHFEQSGHVAAAVLPVQLERFRQGLEFMHSLGFGDEDIRWLNADEIRRRINIDKALGGFHMSHCAAIHPARLARGLADVAERKGVRILERSPVIELCDGAVRTASGRVRADNIVLATEGYTGSLPGLKRKLIPVHSMMVVTEPLTNEEIAATGLTRRYTFNNGNHVSTYGQLTPDRRIAFGCRGSYLYGAKVNPHFDPADPEFRLVERELIRFFPTLREKRFTHAWGGAMGVSRTLTPAVCFDAGKRLGWAGGYFGDGVGAANLAGRTLADLVLGRDTERTHALWVNPEHEKRLDARLWEPEPLRWLGVSARRKLMGWVDGSEQRGKRMAPAMNWLLENVFP